MPKAIARVNDPRNQEHFDLLGITQTVCATTSILGLVEHEVPEHGLVRLLELQKEGLVVVEVQVEAARRPPASGSGGLSLPDGLAAHLGVPRRAHRARRAGDRDAPGRSGARGRPEDRSGARRPARRARTRSARSTPRSEPPVVAGEEHDDRDDLEAPDPHQADHGDLRDVAERRERAHRAGDAEARADVAERRRRRRERVERPRAPAPGSPSRSRSPRLRRPRARRRGG